MRLPLTEQQQKHLRSVRESQLAEWHASPFIVDEIFIEQEVVRLMAGMGRACYLGLDGRVWAGNLGEGERPRVLDDPRDVASCIVRWSGKIGLPELVDALPPMPEGGEVCSLCEGTREMPEESAQPAEDGFRYYCRKCGGLGWTNPA
jgi:hypothetical protein